MINIIKKIFGKKSHQCNISNIDYFNVRKCTTCRFNNGDNCTVGTYYAVEKGLNGICYEGELWKVTENDI
jgi:hypothetical protein